MNLPNKLTLFRIVLVPVLALVWLFPYEETGLRLVSVTDTIGLSYSAVGFSNEMNVCVVGTCDGEIQMSDSSFEEIEAAWYTKSEVRRLLETERFAARTQAYLYMWSRT